MAISAAQLRAFARKCSLEAIVGLRKMAQNEAVPRAIRLQAYKLIVERGPGCYVRQPPRQQKAEAQALRYLGHR